MFKRGEEDRPTLENRRKKYIFHVCILKTTFSAVLLTRRILYNISSSSSFAVSSSTNLLLVLTRTRTHICVVIAVVSPPPWVYFGLCIRRTLPSIGRGLCESYVYLGFEEGVEFIPDVPKFPPSLLHIYIGLVCVYHRYIHIFVYLYSVKRVSSASVRPRLIYLIFSLRSHRNPPRPPKCLRNSLRRYVVHYPRDNCCCSYGKLYYTIYIFIRFGTRFVNVQRSHRHVWIFYSHTSTYAVVAVGQQFFPFIIRRAVKSFWTRLTGLHLYDYYYDFQNEN